MPLDQHGPHLRHDLGEVRGGAPPPRLVAQLLQVVPDVLQHRETPDRPVSRYDDLAGRDWFRFPEGTDPVWRDYWNGGAPRGGPTVRAVQECVQSVLWNGSVGLAPLGHDLGDELVVVPLAGLPPSPVLIAWREDDPLTRDFVEAATQAYALP